MRISSDNENWKDGTSASIIKVIINDVVNLHGIMKIVREVSDTSQTLTTFIHNKTTHLIVWIFVAEYNNGIYGTIRWQHLLYKLSVDVSRACAGDIRIPSH